ncbi:penicillin-binding protein [Gleimia sp. 6138-11-ORH1]|uniref:transglycosylase domain-containing protein n=1 Tax=Gleimia sp. 6138-11-ORH1 TaxID=2973937 RepID=UPI002167F53A|nr:transglycosylase domain-containing protein [Gleimia sp. 6138-11-ORH1]MCS4484745.1 penicillin-binding protein [Gleimia sp. 6138-11-ORH1]
MSKSSHRKVQKKQYLTLIGAFITTSVLSGIVAAGIVAPAAAVVGVTATTAPEVFDSLPAEFEVLPPSEKSTILTADGKLIASFYAENRIVVPLENISENLQKAIVAIEDKRFYDHKGIDPDGMARALVNNLQNRSTQGASTLTQQFVKNTLLENGLQKGDQNLIDEATEQTLTRKLKELRYALALEQKLDKKQILAGYLNIAPFGPNVYGAEASSQRYFSHSATELSISEAALLAGLVKSPVEYDPLTNPEAAQQRRDIVLDEMLRQNVITAEEHETAKGTAVADLLKPNLKPQGCGGAGIYAYFCEYVIQDLLRSDQLGDTIDERRRNLQRGGYTIKTTIDSRLENLAYESVTNRVPVNFPDDIKAVIVSTDPRNGHIKAMAQNTIYEPPNETNPGATFNSLAVGREHGGQNGFVAASTLKPFTLLEFFRKGHSAWELTGGRSKQFRFNEFKACGQPLQSSEIWDVNEAGSKPGSYNAIGATVNSVNRSFAHMATQLDLCDIMNGMRDLGIKQQNGEAHNPNHPSNLINAVAPPLQMSGAYGAFANSGIVCEPMAITEVLDRDKNPLAKFEPKCRQGTDEVSARKVTTVLNRTAASPSYSAVHIGRPIIAKTGTGEDSANLWVLGGTPQLVTAAWIGREVESSRTLNGITLNGVTYNPAYGINVTAPMWQNYMLKAHEGVEVLDFQYGDIGQPPKPKPEKAQKPKDDKKSDEKKSDEKKP